MDHVHRRSTAFCPPPEGCCFSNVSGRQFEGSQLLRCDTSEFLLFIYWFRFHPQFGQNVSVALKKQSDLTNFVLKPDLQEKYCPPLYGKNLFEVGAPLPPHPCAIRCSVQPQHHFLPSGDNNSVYTILQGKDNTLSVFNRARHELSMFIMPKSHRCSRITDHTLNQLGAGHLAKWSQRPERL